MSKSIHIPLEENCFYHVYNRGSGETNLFFQDKNYIHFLRKYHEYLSGCIDTYAYCLLPNHFHLLIYVKDKKDFVARESSFPNAEDIAKYTAEEIVSELFRRFFMSYSKSINVQQGRNGSLFQKTFRRKLIDSDGYFTRMVYYVHHQLDHHGFIGKCYKTYPWSSYRSFLWEKETNLKRKELLDWFGGKEGFIQFHDQTQYKKAIDHLIIEDE
ncbi:hypothetical protein [Dyadobacter arcticus]|uniref:REP element-mobilizing transposase RayT n=1 Tax=Dyadobacter arcticus TaxID=1078754 RepID=A0ABX0UNP1_9BACT|nr:hypothetical protein [Dyadobacter arcticus]NIJ54073.1 REP element-mobilizing transposase RayT [Dyadobacter arcticus]